MSHFQDSIAKFLAGARDLGLEREAISLLIGEAAAGETAAFVAPPKPAESVPPTSTRQNPTPAPPREFNGPMTDAEPSKRDNGPVPSDSKNECLRFDWRQRVIETLRDHGPMVVDDAMLQKAAWQPNLRWTKQRQAKVNRAMSSFFKMKPNLFTKVDKAGIRTVWDLRQKERA